MKERQRAARGRGKGERPWSARGEAEREGGMGKMKEVFNAKVVWRSTNDATR